MIEGLKKLIDLQKLDDELAAAEQESAALPGRRAELTERRDAAEAEREASMQALKEAEAGQRRAETEAQDKQALLQKLEGQQFQVKSNEAYTALLREIEQAREAISDAETQVLEAMEAIDASSQRLADAEARAESTLAGVAEQGRGLDSREKELGVRIGELGVHREQVRGGLERDLLVHYDRVASRRRPAVAQVRDEMCLGCRVHVPPQLQIELLRGTELISCLRCHRILIHHNALEAAK